MNRTVALVPLRAGSKSIPKKNVRPLAGRPLAYWAMKAALECSLIHEVYVASDSQEIRSILADQDWTREERAKLKIIDRRPENAMDQSSTEAVLLEFTESHEFDCVVLIQATSPLLKTSDLERALVRYTNENFDSMVSVVRQKRFFWMEEASGAKALNYDPQSRPRRQEFEGQLVENGAFYITDRSSLLNSRCRLSGRVGLFEMPEETYFEIDEPADWLIIESFLRRRDSKNLIEKLKKVRLVVTDVDGVLTDAGMYYSEEGDESKRFNARDGKGFELLRNAGLQLAIVTQENTKIVSRRAEKLKVSLIYQGVTSKPEQMARLLEEQSLTWEQALYIGDDLNDLQVLRQVGVSVCPADAVKAVKEQADYVCQKTGGQGCYREMADLLLEAVGR